MMQKHSKLFKVLVYTCLVLLLVVGITNLFAMMKYLNLHGTLLPKKETVISPSPEILLTPDSVHPGPPAAGWGSLTIDPNATNELPQSLIPNNPVKDVSVAGFKTLRIPANTKDVSVDFYNPSSNEGEFLMTFELLFPMPDGTRLSLYSSGLVEAGKHIRNISLAYPVPAGTYENCVLRVQPYFISDQTPANTADVVFTLTAA